jgi:hypothetical protein
MGKRLLVLCTLALSGLARAEKFDLFLESMSENLPIQTESMKSVLKKQGTRLAHPSKLEKWGVINQGAAATYNSVLNTIVLKPEYTATVDRKKTFRVKTWNEMKQDQPDIWPVRLATIFHELSHAEFSWLPQSKESVDKELLQFLKIELDAYLKIKYPKASSFERKVAQSELFAYYRDSIFTALLESKNEIFLENGYFGSSRGCRKTEYLKKWFLSRPGLDTSSYAVTTQDKDFSKMPLPTIFVKGEAFEIESKDPIYSLLQLRIWGQWQHHFAPAKSKSEMVRWMNTKPELLKLIKACR